MPENRRHEPHDERQRGDRARGRPGTGRPSIGRRQENPARSGVLRPSAAIAFAAATVSTTVLLAGCAGSAAAPLNSIATESYKATYSDAPASDCPANATDPAIAALRTAKPRTPLPADFQPIAALRCTNAYRTDSTGKTVRVNEVQRAEGDLSGLLGQLRRPDEVKVANAAVGCAAVGQIVPVFGLVDAHGTVIRPRFPLGVCGLIQPEVQAAVNALDWKSETTGETKVTANPDGLTKNEPGCPDTAEDLLDWPQAGAPEPWSRVRHPLIPEPTLICVYTAEDSTTPEPVGTLIGGLKLTPDQVRTVGRALADASDGSSTAPRCDPGQLSLFVGMGGPDQLPYLADLQGCGRLRYPNGFLAPVPAGLADLLGKIAGT